ncbi:Diphthamide biosynthesis protein 2 [Thoreauomyces humboldtii]|nr:Diphthamide biosynthesis protein 2 [Thoreauomyces humboldtii]
MANATPELVGPTTFADDGSAVLQRTVEVAEPTLTAPRDLLEEYDIEETVQYLTSGGFDRISLQFPDDRLGDAADVSAVLREQTGKQIFVLADTTFGSCCIDEIAAEHALADVVVHYGRACLSPTSRLPVFYVFPHAPLDLSRTLEAFQKTFDEGLTQKVLIMSDVSYQNRLGDLLSALRSTGYTDVVASTVPSRIYDPRISGTLSLRPKESCMAEKSEEACCGGGSCDSLPSQPTAPCCGGGSYGSAPLPEPIISRATPSDCRFNYKLPEGHQLDQYAIFYVGPESLSLTNLVLTHSTNAQIHSYNPVDDTVRNEKTQSGRLLMRRYFLVQKAKDADVIGIVVGTLGVASYLSVIGHLKRLITAAGKKFYVLAVGKPNVAKLANFLEIDCFVLVACPENSLLDSRDFLRPVVTPFELELALVEGREWSGEYQTDLSVLAPRLDAGVDEILAASAQRTGDESDEEPYFSLVTGGYKQARGNQSSGTVVDAGSDADGSQLALRDAQTVALSSLGSAGAAYLNEKRTFRGLEPEIGKTEVTIATEGRSGIARGYADETGKNQQ